MSQTMNEDLNVIANSDLKITYLDGDLAIIQQLDDEPNDVGGLTSAQLKAKFDQAGLAIQSYLNNTLIPELLAADATEAAREAAEAGRQAAEQARVTAEAARAAAEQERVNTTSGIVAQATQKAQEAAASAVLAEQVALGNIPDGSLAKAKLVQEVQNAVNRAASGGEIDGLLAGKAPAGYGYGEQMQVAYWSDSDGSQLCAFLDNYIANKFPNDKYGVFRISKFSDYPACLISGNGGYADVYFNKDADDYSKFTVIVSFTGPVNVLDYADGCTYQAVLKRTHGGWKQWEYVNPPMELGKEYRTTQRYLGKPVYVMLMDCGLMPSTEYANVPHGISNILVPISCEAVMGEWSDNYGITSGRSVPSFASATDRIVASFNTAAVQIYTGILDYGTTYNLRLFAKLKYTKTTD